MRVTFYHNAFDVTCRRTIEAPGQTLAELAEAAEIPYRRQPVLAFHQGKVVPLSRWGDSTIIEGEIVDFRAIPAGGGRGLLRTFLMLAAVIVSAYFAPALASAIGFAESATAAGFITGALSSVANFAINALLPPIQSKTPELGLGNSNQTSPTYSINAQGNQSRLGEAIPVVYGEPVMFPDFASIPYKRYDANNDEYLHQLFVVSQGEAEVEDVRLDDSPISSFTDAKWQVIPPRQGITLFDPNWISIAEVGGQETEKDKAIGPFPICDSTQMTNKIEIDLIAPSGLYKLEGDGYITENADFDLQVQEINDQGDVVKGAGWHTFKLSMVGITNNSTPVRRSFKYDLPKRARYQVRLTRTNDVARGKGYSVTNWVGCKAYIANKTVYEHQTLLAVKLKATNQLTNQNERRINARVKRKIPVWNGSSWEVKKSKSIVWSLVDIMRNSQYGAGLPEQTFILPELLALDQRLAKRGDFFNGVIDRQAAIADVLSRVARCGRCFVFQQAGRIRVIRDEPVGVPVQVFTPANIIKDSFSFSMEFWNNNRPKSIEIEFFDSTRRRLNQVEESVESVPSGRVERMQFLGIDSLEHAKREARFEHAQNLYRRRKVLFECEMEALLLTPGDLIRIETPFEGIGTISAKVLAIRPGHQLKSAIEAIIDDPRVYVN